MGRQFRTDPLDFQVFIIDRDFGDAILIFPDEEMARAAIERAIFYIGNGINVELHPYAPELQMAFDPLSARARIRVYGGAITALE